MAVETKRIDYFLAFNPTEGQEYAIYALERFVSSKKHNCTLILKGYAGTGKTSLIAALTAYLQQFNFKTVSLAPTGRAAKVLSSYSGKRATTIHKHIYTRVELDYGGWFFELKENKSRNTIFIVDESSMIGGEESGGLRPGKSLMEDLFTFVFEGKGCRLLFVGDEAQLPPVGLTESPALDVQYLKDYYGGTVATVGLTEVVRQAAKSGILANATHVRSLLDSNEIKVQLTAAEDVVLLPGNELMEAYESAYDRFGKEDVVFVTRSNKTANQINQQIRRTILWREDELEVGDFLMVVKNNYYWMETIKRKNDFIANGETMEVVTIEGFEKRYGFNFATAWVKMMDGTEEIELEVKLWLDALNHEGPSMPDNAYQQLLEAIKAEESLKPEKEQTKTLFRDNEYLQALQVKFAYALTCHKAQGGQWQHVFVEHGYLLEDGVNQEWLRWLYTAITRATKTLYLVNFQPFLLAN
jgi:exodeoxyribonuclease-5